MKYKLLDQFEDINTGTVYEIVEVLDRYTAYNVAMFSLDGDALKFKQLLYFRDADLNRFIKLNRYKLINSIGECTCSSLDLFRYGCKCGHIKEVL